MKPKLRLLTCAFLVFPLGGLAQETQPDLPTVLKDCVYLREEAFKWYVQFDHEDEGKWFALYLSQTHDRRSHFTKDRRMIAVGDTFFKNGPATDRFKFIGFTQKDVTSKRTNLLQNVRVAIYEDLKPNKKGKRYESQYGLPDPEIDANAHYDRTAIFALKSGDEGKVIELKIEELTQFALPPEATSKDYFLKEVGPDQVLIEYRDESGTLRTATIGKKPDTHHTNLIVPATADAKTILERLEKIEVTPHGVENMKLSKAVDLLNRGKDGKATPVINFVLRNSKDNFNKVSLNRTPLSFAAAIDSLCQQTDCRWTIEVEPETEHPVLVISPRRD